MANLLLLNWLQGFGLLAFEQVLVSTRFTAKKQMNSLKYNEWHQEDKEAYNSMFLLHALLERDYMADLEVWLSQIQIQTLMICANYPGH